MAGIPEAPAGEAARAVESRLRSSIAPGKQAVEPAGREIHEASLTRRLGASAYEALLLAALSIAVGFALLPFVTPGTAAPSDTASSASLYVMSPMGRMLSAAATVAVSAAYCVWLWSGGRRTLAMKTWRLVLATASGELVTPRRALLRYLACWVGAALAVASFVLLQTWGHGRWALVLLVTNYAWALVDRERRFLQDRAAGTRLVIESR